jgi:hypothetical protein
MTFSLGSVVGTVLAGGLAPIVGLPGLFLASAAATFAGTVVVARGVAVAGRSAAPASPPAVPVPLVATEAR